MCLHNVFPSFLPSLLSFFSYAFFLTIYFLTCLVPDFPIYYSFQNRPVPFSSGMLAEATKLGFSFLVHFMLEHIFYGCMFAFVMFVQFFSTKPKD